MLLVFLFKEKAKIVSKIYVTSDTHFLHKNICGPTLSSWKEGYRNFDSLESMEDCLVDGINSHVQREDTLIHNGDVCMGQANIHWPRIRERINCRNIILCLGNHDDKITKNKLEYTFSAVYSHYEFRYKGILVVCNHYPLTIWNEVGRGAIMLYGHVHGNYVAEGRSMDVGVDTNNYIPYSLDEILEKMTERKIVIRDHHNEKTSYH